MRRKKKEEGEGKGGRRKEEGEGGRKKKKLQSEEEKEEGRRKEEGNTWMTRGAQSVRHVIVNGRLNSLINGCIRLSQNLHFRYESEMKKT
ncbi:hypothetical protein TB2_012654 [Malus domestica]